MKKLLITLITLALLVTALVSCKESEPKPAEAYVNGTHLSGYTVVYSEDEPDYNKRAAEYIAAAIKERCAIDVQIVTDKTAAAEHEIVVGETNRTISDKLDALCEGVEFAYLADGGSIALEGDYFVIAAAAYYFVDTYVKWGDFESAVPEVVTVAEPIVKEAKNFIVMIGDGMGVNQTLLFDYMENNVEYSDGEDGFYGYYLPYIGTSRTQSLSGITDSAAGGTALATGHKTYNEYIGRDKDGNDVKSLTELAASLGKATAVMSTENNTGATPASFSAHANDRDSSSVINQSQLVTRQQYGTVIDCGYDYYTSKMLATIERHITDTLSKVSADEDGFFLMYEEAHIDKHCHSNDINKTFQAVVRFNQAIGRMMEYTFYNPDTFLLITADHETGDLYEGEDGKLAYHSDDHTAKDVLVFAYGDGAELFDGVSVENIQIAHTIASFMGVTDFGDQSEYSYLGKE